MAARITLPLSVSRMPLPKPKYETFASGIQDMPKYSPNLTKVESNLKKGALPQWAIEAFDKANQRCNRGILEIFAPVKYYRPATTDRVFWCPNLPQWHKQHAEDDEDYLKYTGRFLKLDFDVTDSKERTLSCSMIFNEGDADCNDGFWGAVWDRTTGERLVNVESTGPQESRISLTKRLPYRNHNVKIPRDFWEFDFSANSEFLRLVGFATFVARHPDNLGKNIHWDDIPPAD